ncbi:Hypothetical predicted protein [Mytilus galloprovincialis]|uniref:Uncharacterized protein n=1 Tax=Mytilus galloprovincialis TaxID=29158 RepID=A0A8B6EKP7_MYTGA|nr:Hypothetical predicted protein [Mytilus galloprovincialis]
MTGCLYQGDPSDIAIEDATGQRINTVEGREHTLECSVTSGQPGGNITWSTDGAVVATSRLSSVRYRLIPQRSDNRKLFKCEAFNNEGKKVLESSAQLEVFYIPKITFRPNQTLTVKEGEDTQLMCRNDGNDPDATTVWKRLHKNTIIIQNDELNFKSINRTDAGIYTCRVDTKAGVYEDNAKVVVQYAPTIDIQYSPNERQMKCIPNGLPDRYMFKNWEHTTEYNDHIRFLPTRKDGNTATLTFPTNVTEKNHHEDRGLPYFVSSTENTQFGVYFKTAEIEIKVVSVPEYDSYDVYKNGSRFTDFTELVYRNKKLTDNVYDKNVSVKGTIISLQIQIDSLDAYSSYKIVVKNAVGSSHHTIELVSASPPEIPKILRTVAQQTQFSVLWKPGFDGGYLQRFIVEYKKIGDIYWNYQTTRSSNFIIIGGLQPATKYLIRMFSRNLIDDSKRTEEILIQTDKYAIVETSLSVQSVVILSSVIIIVLLVAGMGLYVRRLKQKHRERMELAMNVETTDGTYDEIAHYTDIIEIDNLQPTSQENGNSTMAMTIRDIDEVSAEQTSTSSDKDRDSSEYLDDGYEKPYTTLVVTDQVKDEHDYLTNKTESNYENSISFQNIACGHASENLEENTLSDKSKVNDEITSWNLNYDMNDFNETKDSMPQTYINPKMNKTEYVNLLLNQ